ncbi:hypothetical protein BV914_10740 [Neisseria dumasiana]|nr:hypothetical protein BV914_10740 [Neisseria dumasiana]
MKEWLGNAGDAYFCSSGEKDHLFVVLFPPNKYKENGFGNRLCVVSVNFTSNNGGIIDDACVVNPGEHPFITHSSYVLYRKIQILDYEHLCNCVNQGVYRAAESVSPELLQKMIYGIKQSKSIPRKFKNLQNI